jgi:hypothetical protein
VSLSEIIQLAKDIDIENQKLKKDTVEQIAQLDKDAKNLKALISEVQTNNYFAQDIRKLKKFIVNINPQLCPVDFEEI